jgi:hypothetical protein
MEFPVLDNKISVISVSVAAAAASVGAGQAADLRSMAPAPAAPVVENPFFVSVEGGAAFSDFAKKSTASEFTQDKLGVSPKTSIGPYASISIGRKIEGTQYDWRVSASSTTFLNNSVAGFYGPFNAESGNSAGFQAGDFDIGRTFKTDLFQARVFAGARAMHAHAKSSYSGGYLGIYSASINQSSRFLGVGPRAGADVRFGQELGLVASVSAAALYGQQQNKTSLGFNVFSYNFGASISDTKYDWVTDVAASLAASWKPSEKTELSAGYRAEKLFSINTPQGKDLMSHGPFLKLDVKY